MLPALTLALALALQQDAVPDPRTDALVLEDALYEIPEVVREVRTIGDLDGDGTTDLAVQRSGPRIDLVSGRNGETVRTLWGTEQTTTLVWDAGGDLNGDGFADLLVGSGPTRRGSGAGYGRTLVPNLVVVSGEDGATLPVPDVVAGKVRLYVAPVFLGDLDGDGHADYALGVVPFDQGTLGVSISSSGVATSAERPGFLTVRFGKDGSELWKARGQQAQQFFGRDVRAAGDVDGDGLCDVLVVPGDELETHAQLLSGSDGERIARIRRNHLGVGPAGDFDGDGRADLFVDQGYENDESRGSKATIVSGRTREPICELRYPDWGCYHGITVELGDLDGDGCAEVAVGQPDFHYGGHPSEEKLRPEVSAVSLGEALSFRSTPWSFAYQSGTLHVYSGKTREVIFAVWGEQNSSSGVGMGAARLDDITGDGFPEVVVVTADAAYVFVGPGAAR